MTIEDECTRLQLAYAYADAVNRRDGKLLAFLFAHNALTEAPRVQTCHDRRGGSASALEIEGSGFLHISCPRRPQNFNMVLIDRVLHISTRKHGSGQLPTCNAGDDSMGRVQSKVVIVTGAAGGLGRATARLLAREGARVIATDLDRGGLAMVAEDGIATLVS
jgi:hypothetical protein